MIKLEQEGPTKNLQERQADVIEALSGLQWMGRFPTDEKQLQVVAMSIAKFCETVKVNHANPADPKPSDLGWIRPVDWLVSEIAEAFIFFPAPILWRKVYETRFQPLDGRTFNGIRGEE